LLTGKGPGKRKNLFYFDGDGDLNAVRLDHEGHAWKITFTQMSGDLPTAWKKSPSWPVVSNLRRDPYEKTAEESGMYTKWMGKKMWAFGPAKNLVVQHIQTLKQFPPRGSSLANQAAMQRQATEDNGLAQ